MTNSDNNMHDIKQEEWTKAVLICVDLGEYDPDQSLLELEELAKTAQAEVQAKVIQRRETYDKATCIGSGRLEEITAFCKENETELLIFDNELTATQTRNIEEITQIRAIDRTTLILDILRCAPVQKKAGFKWNWHSKNTDCRDWLAWERFCLV